MKFTRGIGQIAITVDNVEAAVVFYRDVLGLSYLFSAGPSLAFLDAEGIRIMLTLPEVGQGRGNSLVYFNCPELHGSWVAMHDSDVDLVDSPHCVATMADHELWMFFLRDPSGNLIGMMSEEPLPRL